MNLTGYCIPVRVVTACRSDIVHPNDSRNFDEMSFRSIFHPFMPVPALLGRSYTMIYNILFGISSIQLQSGTSFS